ncbi:MAG: hypothetical protein ACR2JO_02955 [Mycobacteriales bacterium]
MLGAQSVERFGNQPGSDEGARRDHDHGRVREPEAFGDDHGAEIRLVADEEVGSPLRAECQQCHPPIARQPAGEAVAKVAVLPFGVELAQRERFRWTTIRAGGNERETRGLNCAGHPGPTGDGHQVAGGLGGCGQRGERIEVAVATREAEENPHRDDLPRARGCCQSRAAQKRCAQAQPPSLGPQIPLANPPQPAAARMAAWLR